MRRLNIGVAVAAVFAGAVVGYWAGVRGGVELARSSAAVENGAVAVQALRLIADGHADTAERLLEAGVDDGLMGWSGLTLQRSRFSERVFGSGLPHFDDERFVVLLARYRKTHASPWAAPAGIDAFKSLDPQFDAAPNWRALE
jgi:hypothetical protein